MRTSVLIARTALVLALPLVLAGCPGNGGGGGGYRVGAADETAVGTVIADVAQDPLTQP